MVEPRDHKLVVVTGGAGGGIGQGVSTVLAREGWQVLIVDTDQAAAASLVDRLESERLQVKALIADLTDDATPDAIVEAALSWGNRIDGLVNNAGISAPNLSADVTDAEYDRITALNLRAIFRVSRAVVGPLSRRGGAIINISSVHALATAEGNAIYAATKAAVLGLTRGLAVDLGANGIRVNSVLPGLVDSPQSRRVLAGITDDVEAWMTDFVKRRQVLRHTVDAKDVGNLVAFLLGDRARSITGQSLVVDAGLTALLFDREARS